MVQVLRVSDKSLPLPHRPVLDGNLTNTYITMGKFLNPFTDVGFKKLFGQEVNKFLLIEFLNDLLVGEHHVVDISFMNKEIVPEAFAGRVVIFDILCKDTDGSYFIIEMQNQYQDYFFDRGLYYLCRMIGNQGKRGTDWNYQIYPVYGIYFLNFRLPQLVKFRTDVVLSDRENGVVMNNKLRQIYLSLPYFTLEAEDCHADFECWIYLLKHMETLDRMPFEAKKAVFKKLLEVADVENRTPDERECYEESLKAYRDYVNTIATAERISREKGIAEGEAKGKAEGEAEGKRQMSVRMKKEGLPTEMIARCSDLSIEEIEKL